MRILIITDSLPFPLVSGNRIRLYNLIRRIAEKHQVSIATLVESSYEQKFLPYLEELCVNVIAVNVKRQHPLLHIPGLISYALNGIPLELKFKYSKELENKIQLLVSSQEFDIVQIEPSHMALYLRSIPNYTKYYSVLMFYDIAFAQFRRIFRVERRTIPKIRALLHTLMMRRWEPRFAENFDRCITVSNVDKRLLHDANPHLQIDVVPNGVDTHLYKPLPKEELSPSLLFVGRMNYPPCADAAMFFCQKVLPLIQKRIKNVEVWLVGREPEAEVLRLKSDKVHITGRVDNLIPFYEQSSVCIVPLRSGGGTRLKILEAMALGRPVVSTSIGCEGLEMNDGEHLMIADEPEEFAQKIYRLLTERPLWENIRARARDLVVERYDWDLLAAHLTQIYNSMIG